MRTLLLIWLGGSVFGSASPTLAGEAFADLDLALDCASAVAGTPGSKVLFTGVVRLQSTPGDPTEVAGARAWSLSIRSKSGVRILSATTTGTSGGALRAADGYEKTELTSGPDNEGAVSAVILSFAMDVFLPARGEATLLQLGFEVLVPDVGEKEHEVGFVDGLTGSGQPVKNTFTHGEGITRRDDGGALDNDADGYDPCRIKVQARASFRRGDTNGDDRLGLTDAVVLLEHLFEGGVTLKCSDAADANDDGEVNLSDAAFVLLYLFRGGPQPPAPYPACGLDETASALDCFGRLCR